MNLRLEQGKRVLIIDCMTVKSIVHISVWLIRTLIPGRTHLQTFYIYENGVLIESRIREV